MRVGIIGAGQLGLMLGEASAALGIECLFLDPSDKPPAGRVGEVVQASFDDTAALASLATRCDVLTYEFENVPVDALRGLTGIDVFPPLSALAAAQDRLSEKQLFEQLGISLPACRAVNSREDLDDACTLLGVPLVLKTRRFGYDGKGQAVVRADTIDDAWSELGGSPLIAESLVDFDFEVSIIATRGTDGDIVTYPLTQNTHRDGILDTSVAPSGDDSLRGMAEDYVRRLLNHFGYVGTLALELFVCGDRLLANEIAPRVHNSGHWTIEGCSASQFENHMRAVTGTPLVVPEMLGFAGMKNLIGHWPVGIGELKGVALHDYGKAERPGRKLGHITVTAESLDARDRMLGEISEIVTR